MWWLAQTSNPPDLSWLSQLGPFLPFGALAVFVIAALFREMARRDAAAASTHDELRRQRDASEARVRELSDKAIDTASHTAPLLAEATRVLEQAVRTLERERDRRRGL